MPEQFLKLAEDFIVGRVMGNHAPLTHANKALMIATIIGAITLALGIVFMMSGLYVWLMQSMPRYEAYTVFGLCLTLLAVITIIAVAVAQAMKNKRIAKAQAQMRDEVLLSINLAAKELENVTIIQDNPKTATALASLAGYVLADYVR